MSILNRLKKYAGLNKDKDRCPSNPCVTVREAIEVADHIETLTKQRDELLANSKTCNWEYSDDGHWTGDCGIAFCIEEETPSKNDMNYCPKCGGKLVEFIKVKGCAA